MPNNVTWAKKDGHWDLNIEGKPPLHDILALEEPAPETGDHWGVWEYNAPAHTLTAIVGENRLPVHLNLVKTPNDALVAVMLAAEKVWMPVEAVGDFVRALDSILDLWAMACPD